MALSESNEPIVFGSITSVNKYKRANGMKVEPIKEHTNMPTAVRDDEGSVAYVIGGEEDSTDVTVTEEELDLLDNILLRNDPDVVYMQEDFSFYDEYYLSDTKIDDALLTEVRSLRRIYRNYEKYMYACYIREKYLSYLHEKYAVDSIVKYTGEDTVVVPRDVFIPPYPIYSKNAKDYDEVMSGRYTPKPEEIEPPSREELETLIDHLLEWMDRDPSKIKCVPGGIETFLPALAVYDTDESIPHSSKWSGPSSVSVTDLDSLQKMIRSWHKKEEAEVEQTRERIPFPMSEEGIKKRYYNEIAYYIEDHIDDANKDPDENEMVYDDVSKKPMTRKEYLRRKTLRMLAENAGWDMVKLMSQLNVGSKMERKILRNKAKGRKKAIKKANDFMSSITGTAVDYDYGNTAAMSGEELRAYLFGD